MIKVTEDYVSYEVAKLLNEKGFEIDTNNDYWKIGEDGIMYFMSSIGAYSSNPNDVYAIYRPENSYPCATYQMAMKWLRTKGIYIYIQPTKYVGGALYGFQAIVEDGRNSAWKKSIHHEDNYEEAVEAALKYVLENLI